MKVVGKDFTGRGPLTPLCNPAEEVPVENITSDLVREGHYFAWGEESRTPHKSLVNPAEGDILGPCALGGNPTPNQRGTLYW